MLIFKLVRPSTGSVLTIETDDLEYTKNWTDLDQLRDEVTSYIKFCFPGWQVENCDIPEDWAADLT
jgi:hypothetical protein